MDIKTARIPSAVVLNARIARITSPSAFASNIDFWEALTRQAGKEVGDREIVLIVLDALLFDRSPATNLSACVDLLIGEESPEIATSARKILEGIDKELKRRNRSQGIITV